LTEDRPPSPAARPLSLLRRFAVNTSIYSVGNLLVMAGGLVSFPILTRLLSVDEYGLMEVVNVTLLFLVGVGKLGVQNSAIRFYGRVTSGSLPFTLRQYYSTVLFGMGGTALALTLLWLAASPLTPEGWLKDERVPGLFQLTAVLVFVRVAESALVNIIRAQQRAAMHSAFNVVKRYVGIALTIGSLLLVSRSVHGFYYGLIANEVLCVVVLGAVLHRFARFSPSQASAPLFREMLAFGAPLVGSELGSALLNLGDRYILQILLGAQRVGEYSAAYNLCEYAEIIAIASVGTAIGPIYTRLYDEKGRQATEAFLARSLRYYFLVGLPLIAGMTAVGPDALTLLASEKYAPGRVVIPWVIAGTFVGGLQPIAVAGLYVANRTKLIVLLVIGSAAFNIALNLALVPRMGIEGAGVATLASYVLVTASMEAFSRRVLHVRFPWTAALRYGLASLAMYAAVEAIPVGSPVLTLALRVACGAAVYAVIVAAVDRHSRELALDTMRRLRGMRRPNA
jgi:O-antigen/teichoic acid export membrane protein